jgi:catalase
MGTSTRDDRGDPALSMRHLDQLLDEALDATYPASDPVAITEDHRPVTATAAIRPPLRVLAAIGVIIAACAFAFAYTGGWLSPQRLTPARMVDALGRRGGDPVGHRRNHAKGICFTGDFEANGAGAMLSAAPMLAQGRYPVIGRFAIATGNPQAPDATARVRSMAIRITAPNREEWRSGMNDSPVFAVSTPEAFYEMTQAQEINPLTNEPDPLALARFSSTHPESRPFAAWAKSAPWTASYADQVYNSRAELAFRHARHHR